MCFIFANNNFGNINQRNISKVFAFLPDLFLWYFPKAVQTFAKKNTFTSDQSFYETLRSFITSKTMEKKIQKLINKCIYNVSEFGFALTYATYFPNYTGIPLVKTGGKDGFLNYNSLQDFISNNTLIVALSLDKLDYFFRLYFIFSNLILLINLIHYLFNRFYHLILLYYLVFFK